MTDYKEIDCVKNNWTHERVSRKAEAYQWDGSNADQIFWLLAQHGMVGELFRDNQYIQVYYEQGYDSTLRKSDWLLVGEDSVLRFYSDENFRLMYHPLIVEPITKSGLHNDEVERLRAFAREVIAEGMDNLSILSLGVRHGLLVPRECGLALDLVDSLKVSE